MPVNSRSKGKRGELQLAAALTALTGRTWRRSQQRRGTATADVECDGTRLHVECKRVAAGLARLRSAINVAEVVAVAAGDSLFIVGELSRIHDWGWPSLVRSTILPRIVRTALAQAERDRNAETIPLVCVREDRGGWFVCCRADQLAAVRAELSPTIHAGPPAPLSGERAHGCAAGSGVA